MSENTPERLREFRSAYTPSPQRAGLMSYVQLVLLLLGFGAVIALLALREQAPAKAGTPNGGLSAEQQRQYAAYLAEKQQPTAAVAAYQAYLDTASLAPNDRAKVCYATAKLAVEAEQYAAALPYLYEAEFLDPNSDIKDEINKKVVLCLDKLGRNVDLRHELRKRTEVKRTAADVKPEEKVLAEFAGEVITNRDLELEIEKLPASVRDSFSAPEKKADFLKNMVAQRLLLDKARRLELDKTPEIQDELGKQLDAMIVQKLIEDEVKAGINITPEDVERFYKAAPERFTDPATAEVCVAKADTEEAAKAITEFPDKPVVVRKGGPVPGAPPALEASDAIFNAEPDAIAGPLQAEKAWYVFKIKSKTPEKLRPFEEVKDQATKLFQMQKEQEKVRALIEETLKARDVHLYLDRIGEPGSSSPSPAKDDPSKTK